MNACTNAHIAKLRYELSRPSPQKKNFIIKIKKTANGITSLCSINNNGRIFQYANWIYIIKLKQKKAAENKRNEQSERSIAQRMF